MPFCHKCGATVESGDDFCFECGAPVRKNKLEETLVSQKHGLVVAKDSVISNSEPIQSAKSQSNADLVIPEITKDTSINSINDNSNHVSNKKKFRIIAFIAIGLSVLGVLSFVVIKLVGEKSTPKKTVPTIDVKKYFEENSEIKSVSSVKKSKNRNSEKEIVADLTSRGFIDYPVTTSYSSNGNLIDTKEVSSSSSEKHPVYETYFQTSNGDIWLITIIDGAISATPISYNFDEKERVPIMLSESDEIVSFDSSTNSFYRTVPKDSVLRIVVVNRIDAQTLDSIKLED